MGFLSECDLIVMLEEACIRNIGSYEALIDEKGVFYGFASTSVQSLANEGEKLDPKTFEKNSPPPNNSCPH